MIDLNKEAEDYSIKHHLDKHKYSGDKERISFIAGANSTYVQAKIIQAQIDVLREIDNKCFGGSNTCKAKIEKLQQQLKQLENEIQ
jgi:hypothetical protein